MLLGSGCARSCSAWQSRVAANCLSMAAFRALSSKQSCRGARRPVDSGLLIREAARTASRMPRAGRWMPPNVGWWPAFVLRRAQIADVVCRVAGFRCTCAAILVGQWSDAILLGSATQWSALCVMGHYSPCAGHWPGASFQRRAAWAHVQRPITSPSVGMVRPFPEGRRRLSCCGCRVTQFRECGRAASRQSR